MTPGRTAGVVLAGGLSRRMGKDKAALVLEGRTLLERMTERLRASGLGTVYISGPGCIEDLYPGQGPLGGIYSVPVTLGDRYDRYLFVPVDMPAIEPASLARLLAEPMGRNPVLRFGEVPMPFLLRVDARVLALMETLLQEGRGGVSVRTFQRFAGVTSLPLPAEWAQGLVNLNTPGDWLTFTGEEP
ncbi:molybdenum cofactor guanylyltransferase [Phaeovibrio sulfidiphilus]|uniref:Molybdenum cofactor guanylyltransferase n=1 Tax=Phaeovibrio sulfidiphilus TaxID=1220600 RepID=A0A8J6YMM1_9PROT|nr:molybdenum cofactor guanylyltransferase [Phaeovibrio sulfidiphilus]MBE1237390.1 molybdenum cofactor guanylyltransferase [Phaeovibrio sulfidiphilus]